jgi:hypothetical protein
MGDKRPSTGTWGEDGQEEASFSGQGAGDAWEDDEPAENFQPVPDWDPLWDAFEPYDRYDEPEPDPGDFWSEPDDDGL